MGAEATASVAAARRAKNIKVPSVLRCGLMIFAIKVALKARGFGRTIAWIRRTIAPIPEVSANAEIVKAAEHPVAMAGALYPGRAKCLEQSLVLYYALRHAGIAARFRLGVQPHPFLAHAWIEYLEEPINDVPEHVKHFTRLQDPLP